jgi:hypothetical protein
VGSGRVWVREGGGIERELVRKNTLAKGLEQ